MQLEDYFISQETSVVQAMQKIDENGRRILFIVQDNILKAALTDGDIRKFILRGGELAHPVKEVANYKPKFLPVGQRAKAQEYLLKNYIDAVPLLGEDGKICDIIFLNNYNLAEGKKALGTPVVIMAGGLGTRLYPYTKILPKPLIPIGEVPIIELVMEKFAAFGCGPFNIVVNYRKNMIKSYFADLDSDYQINWVDEAQPLGTGGGLCLLNGKLEKTFFLTNCDSIIDADYADIAKYHKENANLITMVCAMKQYTIPYGVVELAKGGEFDSVSEKPCMNFLTNTGLYLVEASVLSQIEKDKRQGFPDIIEDCKAAGGRIGVYPISEGSWMDMGQIEELDEMRRRFEQKS